jgi:hypothetical protein
MMHLPAKRRNAPLRTARYPASAVLSVRKFPFLEVSPYRTLSAVKSLLAFGHRLGFLAFDVGRVLRLPPCATGLPSEFCAKPTCIGF